jgi:hypothetical protein
VSAVVLIGALGTLLTTVQMLPHLAAAIRTRTPSGSAIGWTLSMAAAAMWGIDGLVTSNLWLLAPTTVTVPVYSALAIWVWRSTRQSRRSGGHSASRTTRPSVRAMDQAYRLDDTIELPRLIAA